MSIVPLNQGNLYFDPISNFVLQAEGTVDANDCHNFTMLHPTYNPFNIHDSAVKKLILCNYDPWTITVEYQDSITGLVKINLVSKTQTFSNAQTSPNATQQQTPSQKNHGWAYEEPKKKPEKTKPSIPFKVGSILFHKSSRTKWIFAEVDNVTRHPVLRSFYDKSQAMQIFEKDYEEFEEIFF